MSEARETRSEEASPRAAPDPRETSAKAKKKIVFVISHLGPGGAQRVVTNAVEILSGRGVEVHLLVFTERADSYPIDPRAKVHYWLPRGGGGMPVELEGNGEQDQTAAATPKPAPSVKDRIKRVVPHQVGFAYELVRISAWLRRKIKAIGPDAVLAFLTQTNIMTVLATRGLGVRTVISERNDPRLQRHRPRVEYLRRLVYPRADIVTANSLGALDSLAAFVPRDKLAFLPNPLMPAPSREQADLAVPTIVTVGRLVEQKGLDVLLTAWSKASTALPGWRLMLIGGGPLDGELKALAAKLGVAGSVTFAGHVDDPFPLLKAAKLFVLTSRFEGTPNALLEAMACGLPAIVSNASPGPCELIGTGDDAAGLIVPVEDAEATAAAMVSLASDEALRKRLGANALRRVAAHEADQAIDAWLRLLACE